MTDQGLAKLSPSLTAELEIALQVSVTLVACEEELEAELLNLEGLNTKAT